jgi:hypothetical protein
MNSIIVRVGCPHRCSSEILRNVSRSRSLLRNENAFRLSGHNLDYRLYPTVVCRLSSTTSSQSQSTGAAKPSTPASTPVAAASDSGTAAAAAATADREINHDSNLYARTRNRGPVSWPSLFLVGVAAASAVGYYQIERERRLEAAMGKVVTSESDGWSPRPNYLAKRKFVATKYGWFPMADGFGAREF